MRPYITADILQDYIDLFNTGIVLDGQESKSSCVTSFSHTFQTEGNFDRHTMDAKQDILVQDMHHTTGHKSA